MKSSFSFLLKACNCPLVGAGIPQISTTNKPNTNYFNNNTLSSFIREWESFWKCRLQPPKKCNKAKYGKKTQQLFTPSFYNAGVFGYEMSIGNGDLENEHTCSLANQLTLRLVHSSSYPFLDTGANMYCSVPAEIFNKHQIKIKQKNNCLFIFTTTVAP